MDCYDNLPEQQQHHQQQFPQQQQHFLAYFPSKEIKIPTATGF